MREKLPELEELKKKITSNKRTISSLSKSIKYYELSYKCLNEFRNLQIQRGTIVLEASQALKQNIRAKIKKNQDVIQQLSSNQCQFSNANNLKSSIKSINDIYEFIQPPEENNSRTRSVSISDDLSKKVQSILRIVDSTLEELKEKKSQRVELRSQSSAHQKKLQEMMSEVNTYHHHLHKALNDYKTSLERSTECDNEVLQEIKTRDLYSKIEKKLKSSEDKLADLHKECTLQNKIKDDLQIQIAQLEKDISKQKENIVKQRKNLEGKEKKSNKEKERIQRQISEKREELASTKREGNTIRKELYKLEPAVVPALRQVDAAQRQVDQAQMEVDSIGRSLGNDEDQVWKHIETRKKFLEKKRDELVSQLGGLLGHRSLSGENRLTSWNAGKYSEKWADLEPITHPQASKFFQEDVIKASQAILNRLGKVPKDHSQSFFWMRYAGLMNQTIDVYKNPQPEGAQERLMKALETLDKANKIANAFLDVMYGKEQKASSSQGQA